MKKIIQYEALFAFQAYLANTSDLEYEYQVMLNLDRVSRAQIRRFNKVLQEMVENAESKLD